MGGHGRAIAVVGAGVSGLTAAYLLRRSAEVTVFEASDRCGGHAHTHDVADATGALAVDSGFLVHNRRNYPLLCRLFDELGVATQPTEMSMSVRCDGCGLEYCGARGPRGLFASPRNLTSRRFLSMLWQVPRFHRSARRSLARGDGDEERSVGEFLRDGGFDEYFVRHFAVPLVSAVWSCGPGEALGYPATYLFRFLSNHGMLSVGGSPRWRTVTGGSRTYVDAIVKALPDVRTLTPVRAVRRVGDGAVITDGDGGESRFDAVVLACHADQALAMLADPTADERDVLSRFRYSHNPTVLHTDASRLPRFTGARGSWNYHQVSCDPGGSAVRVSYHLNRLHRLRAASDFVVTLGPETVPGSHVLARMDYRHPIYTAEAVRAQRRLPGLNTAVTTFAGAYHGWGFHEDGCRSGVAAAERLGATW
ncbi:putative NAD/FAD-binding protein [Stackebrandtia albiflava]|uniref:Putative NAD/FAD-binding protein n=1 Tax=Stackebrandtia albiflava TaxID=406432 RepID=A0A562VAM2_9ACTN|nr:FAD-dependent oxidoreductase [Stackebrandtia albiflava]TWJ14940.1 putative NAD/FAD-binding protein [Stackebrandtia albiflava]